MCRLFNKIWRQKIESEKKQTKGAYYFPIFPYEDNAKIKNNKNIQPV